MAGLIVVIFGLMGTGKSTLADALAKAKGWPVIHSDLVRKQLAGLEPTVAVVEEFGQGIYSEAFSRKTYAEMLRQARQLLAKAPVVILDGSFKRAAERERVRQAAREWGAKPLFVYCECPKETVRRRLVKRTADGSSVSDGRLELLDLQEKDFDPLGEKDRPLLRLDTGRDLESAVTEVLDFLAKELSSQS
uniref:Shikimate kinase n=1 Tax=Desulfobacca acetoxidans TaxID=60893 RepID=A0A7C3WSI3_9BACT